jgi:hypothetical protein
MAVLYMGHCLKQRVLQQLHLTGKFEIISMVMENCVEISELLHKEKYIFKIL